MMFRVFLLCAIATFATVQAATTTTKKPHVTHHPHVTGEPGERDSVRFLYEAHTHQMVVVNNHKCYIFTLSDNERTAVHTDVGLRTLELKLLNLLSSGTQTEVVMADQPKPIVHGCGHVQHVYTVA